MPAAAGLSNFARIIAAGFSVSLITTFWDRREAFHQSRLAEMTSGFTPVFNQFLSLLQDLGLSDLSAKAAISRNMVGQAYLLAAMDMFTVSAWLCILGIVLVWLCHKVQPHGPPTAVE